MDIHTHVNINVALNISFLLIFYVFMQKAFNFVYHTLNGFGSFMFDEPI